MPTGQILHKDLSTSFTNFNELLLELRENRFSGYIRLNFWGFEGILILDVGKIIQGYSSEKDNFLLGEKAVQRMLRKSTEKEGTIDVNSLSNEMAIALASVLGATLYKSENEVMGDALQEIFGMLEEKGLTGYVDIQFGGKKGLGTIYVLEGMPVEGVIMSSTGRMIAGDVVVNKMLEISRLIKSSVKVFWNAKVEQIQEEKAFLIPGFETPAFDFWNSLLNIFLRETDTALKKKSAFDLWWASKTEASKKYKCLDPAAGLLQWDGKQLVIREFIPLIEFAEGMILSLALTVQKISPRKRKKIRVDRILQEFTGEMKKSAPEDLVYDPMVTIKRIFREQ